MRASTAVINAYLSPVMTDYLDRLTARIANLFGDARLFVIQANGGATTVETARSCAVAVGFDSTARAKFLRASSSRG